MTRVRAAQVLAAVGLLATIGYALAVAQRQEALLRVPDDPQAQVSLNQALSTALLHVVPAAAALWLVLLGRRSGFVAAAILGVVGVLVFTAALTVPRDPGFTYTPGWLQAVGVAAAVVTTLGGALGLRPAGSGPIDSAGPMG